MPEYRLAQQEPCPINPDTELKDRSAAKRCEYRQHWNYACDSCCGDGTRFVVTDIELTEIDSMAEERVFVEVPR